MRVRPLIGAIAALILLLSGCTGDPPNPADSTAGGVSRNINAGEPPSSRPAGTLRVVGNSDVDHLDTVAGFGVSTWNLMRTYTRQLFTYPAAADLDEAAEIVADIATDIPTVKNGGIKRDGTVVTVNLRADVYWDSSPKRAVTAADFVLGFKRLCNPTPNSVGAPSFYRDVFVGMDEYCDRFANVEPDVASIRRFISENEIEGVRAEDEDTLVFTLTKPTADILNILAMPFSSPAPVEYLDYLPDSNELRQNTISTGPYRISSYTPGQSYRLDINPAWDAASDPVRHQYVDAIEVTLGADATNSYQQVMAGSADMLWDSTVPVAAVAGLLADDDPRLGIYPSYSVDPFVVLNTLSPNNDGALGKVGVRRALQYAIDKVALGRIFGGPRLNKVLNQVIPPGNAGHEEFNLYETEGDRGNPDKCRQLLSEAGYPDGLVLKDVYGDAGNAAAVFESIQADLAKCGVKVEGVPASSGDFFGKYLSNPNASKSGQWDIAEPGWIPVWPGNNARAIVPALFDGRAYGPGTTDWSGYNSKAVNRLIDRALASGDPDEVSALMAAADRQIMEDAVVIPLQTRSVAIVRSDRVHNAFYMPTTGFYDLTQVWLDQEGS